MIFWGVREDHWNYPNNCHGMPAFWWWLSRHRSVTGRLRGVLLHLDFPAMFEGTVRVWVKFPSEIWPMLSQHWLNLTAWNTAVLWGDVAEFGKYSWIYSQLHMGKSRVLTHVHMATIYYSFNINIFHHLCFKPPPNPMEIPWIIGLFFERHSTVDGSCCSTGPPCPPPCVRKIWRRNGISPWDWTISSWRYPRR